MERRPRSGLDAARQVQNRLLFINCVIERISAGSYTFHSGLNK